MENEFFLWFCLAVLTIMGVLMVTFFYTLRVDDDESNPKLAKGAKSSKA